MRRLLWACALLALVFLTACQSGSRVPPLNYAVLVGAGTGTVSVNAYFPSIIRIREGDTVTWAMNAQGDPHTVTFTDTPESLIDIIATEGNPLAEFMVNPKVLHPTRNPGEPVEAYSGSGYYNSGVFFGVVGGVPQLDRYSLTFDTPGAYSYVCAIHEYMKGTVIVDPPSAGDLPSPEEVFAQASQEMSPLLDVALWNQQLANTRRVPDEEPGADGSSIFVVNAGIGPRIAEVMDFFPKQLTVKSGDTVVWISNGYHSVVFPGDKIDFPYYLPLFPPGEQPVVAVNPEIFEVVNDFEDNGFFSSGIIGPGLRGYGVRREGLATSLTFSEPGTYRYICPIHLEVGMIGLITVEPN